MIQNNSVHFFGLSIFPFNYKDFTQIFVEEINNKRKITITYATTNSLNLTYKSSELKNIYGSFDIIHPDGVGIYIASKLLYGKNGFKNRFTGSDFYPYLIKELILRKFSIFFFGDTIDTLNKLKINHPELNIVGCNEGFNFNTIALLETINSLQPDILIVGLGSPKQERWIMESKNKINAKVFLAVGDGIKVFAGTKIRGPIFVRKIGLEWMVRLLSNPKYFWKRYIIGIPIFFYRIVKFKFSKHL